MSLGDLLALHLLVGVACGVAVYRRTYPPVGRALLTTDAPDFCHTVEAELEAESYIDGVTCEQWVDSSDVNADAPVSTGDQVD